MLGRPKSRRLRLMIALGPEVSFEAESIRAPTPRPAPVAMGVWASNCERASGGSPEGAKLRKSLLLPVGVARQREQWDLLASKIET